MDDICLTSILDFLKRITFITPIISSIGAIGSFIVAYLVKKNNGKTAEHKKISDLYCIVIQLSSIVQFFTNLYDLHNTANLKDIERLIDKLMHLDKSILDTTKPYFYNNRFNTDVLSKINLFMNDYSAWKGWTSYNETEILTEFALISYLKVSALQVIKTIQYTEKDEKILYLLKEQSLSIDECIKQYKNDVENAKYVGDNLYTLFLLPRYQYNQKQQKNIVLNIVKIYLSSEIDTGNYIKEKELIFKSKEIFDEYYNVKQMKNFLDSLITY